MRGSTRGALALSGAIAALAAGGAAAHAGAFPGTSGPLLVTSGGTLYSESASGGARTAIATGVQHAQASADGTKVVYDDGANIFIANADGSSPTQLTSDGTSVEPSLSPDGTRIAYLSNADSSNPGQIWTMDADGSNPAPLWTGDASGELNSNLSDPVWSPDGHYIAFIDGGGYAFAAQATGEVSPLLVSFNADRNGGLSWAPNSSRLVYTCSSACTGVQSSSLDREYSTPIDDAGSDPVFSPDGTQVADLESDGIHVVPATGGDAGSPVDTDAGARLQDWAVASPADVPKLTITQSAPEQYDGRQAHFRVKLTQDGHGLAGKPILLATSFGKTRTLTTNSAGTVSWSYTYTQGHGTYARTDTIGFCYDANDDGTCGTDPQEAYDAVFQAWFAPAQMVSYAPSGFFGGPPGSKVTVSTVDTPSGDQAKIGNQLFCAPAAFRDKLAITYGPQGHASQHTFTLQSVISRTCDVDPNAPSPPNGNFENFTRLTGSGTGLLDGAPATITYSFTGDQPPGSDTASVTITDQNGDTALSFSGQPVNGYEAAEGFASGGAT